MSPSAKIPAIVALAVGLMSCGDGLNGTTTTSGPTVPSPTPRTTPTPTPAPTVSVKSCTLPPLPNCAADVGPYEFGCCTERNIENPEDAFLDAIAEAQEFVANTQGSLFNGSFVKPGSERAYTAAVVKRIVERTGICAAAPTFIPEDEITLKSRQDRGEIFDIIQGDGLPTRRYTTVCLPAIF